jgi:hypothetical protein
MKKMSKGLFQEMLAFPVDEEQEVIDDPETLEESEENEEDESANISFVGSPVYPRVFWGDSAKPLMGQFPESEYVDDNIHRTYQGLLSYLG